MKKFLFVMASLFLSLTLANANDLLFKASNGALNQNSAGVKKLTDEEMTQVKGGTYLYTQQPAGQYLCTNRYGERIWYKEYYAVVATQADTQAMRSFFSWLTIVDPANEIVTIEATYNFLTRQVETKFVVVNLKTRGHRYNVSEHPTSQRIYANHKDLAERTIYQNRYNSPYRY